ncbi:MAG: DUF6278 family protein [Acidimicrobiales bacterium]
MGPKHGIARGVAVYGTAISNGVGTADGLLPDSGRLKTWSLAHGVILRDDSESLEDLDTHLDQWSGDQSHHEHVDLSNEVGIYLGNVIVKSVAGAQWKVWPNGHPVISFASASELDVIVKVGERLSSSGSSLPSIYSSATSK